MGYQMGKNQSSTIGLPQKLPLPVPLNYHPPRPTTPCYCSGIGVQLETIYKVTPINKQPYPDRKGVQPLLESCLLIPKFGERRNEQGTEEIT